MSDCTSDAYGLLTVGAFQILQRPCQNHRSAAGDLQSPHTAGEVYTHHTVCQTLGCPRIGKVFCIFKSYFHTSAVELHD